MSFQGRMESDYKIYIGTEQDSFRDWHFIKSHSCGKQFVLCQCFNAYLTVWPCTFFLFNSWKNSKLSGRGERNQKFWVLTLVLCLQANQISFQGLHSIFSHEIPSAWDFPGDLVAKTTNAGGLGLILGQRTRSHMLQIRVCIPQLKIPRVAMKNQCSHINT